MEPQRHPSHLRMLWQTGGIEHPYKKSLLKPSVWAEVVPKMGTRGWRNTKAGLSWSAGSCLGSRKELPCSPNDAAHSSAPAHSHLIRVLNILLQVLISVVGTQTLPRLCGSPPARATPTHSPTWFHASSSGLGLSMVATWLVNVSSHFCFCSYDFKVFRETSTFSEEDYFEGCQVKVPATMTYNLNLIPGIHRVKVL